jgi:UDP-N-acetylmuramoyl-L-alanyl-D-glutamate--2,6-diaminopimelate ligase
MSAAMSFAAGLSLAELARELGRVRATVSGDASVRITDVRQDSRRVVPGDLFVARDGLHLNGAHFAAEAVRVGAVAILAERRDAPLAELGVPVVLVDGVRMALGLAAEAVHGHPTEALGLVGITGTNGKTTTAWLAEQLIDASGGAAARLGTLGYAFRDDVVEDSLTTPEADDVSRFAARALAHGAMHFVMEVSSHALVQRRVDALAFRVGAFTNLTQDHLDFHGSMDAYGEAKARLFTDLVQRAAVVNVDDPFGKALAARAPGRVLRVGSDASCDVRPLDVRVDHEGLHGRVALPSGEWPLASRLVGQHNLENVLVALGIVEALGLDVATAVLALRTASAAPGRLERVDVPGDDVTVLVDYAHTPDALARVLEASRRLTAGKLHCVFGCGGDRDPKKRPLMGDAVGAAADRVTLTSDNPRTEAPEAIARAVEPALAARRVPYDVVLDRATAIERAVLAAAPGDLVLIAGKGHEPYQIIGTEKRPFDDRVEARRALAVRRGGRP